MGGGGRERERERDRERFIGKNVVLRTFYLCVFGEKGEVLVPNNVHTGGIATCYVATYVYTLYLNFAWG